MYWVHDNCKLGMKCNIQQGACKSFSLSGKCQLWHGVFAMHGTAMSGEVFW